ncbi:MAG: ATP-binding protein [Nitrospirota bacterium]
MMKKRAEYYRKLRRNIIIVTLAVALVPLVVLSWSASRNYQKYYKENISSGMMRMVENRKDVINFFLAEQKSFLSIIAELYGFNYLKEQENLEEIFKTLQKKAALVDIGVINRNGRHTAYVGPYKQIVFDKNYREEDWFKHVMVKGTYISDVFLGYRNIPHFIIAIAAPQREWVLRATIDSEMFDSLVKSAHIGVKGDAFIVNSKGVLQTVGRFGTYQLSPEERRLLYFHQGTKVEELETSTGKYLYATSWIKDNEWIFVVKFDTKSELLPFFKARRIEQWIILFASLLIITSAMLVVNFLVNKIEKADRLKAAYDEQLIHTEKIAAIGRLAAGVAHEVNNPLAVINEKAGWMQDLLSEEDRDKIKNYPEFEDAIKKIKLHVERARKVTHRLLGFSRRVEGEKEIVNINQLIKETVSFLEKELLYHKIELITELDEYLPAISTNSSEVQQVFLNILNNGIDAIGTGGSIKIMTTSDPENVVVSFCDTGHGIPDDFIDKVFDPFFTTKKVGKGTGLGLSVSYNIIKKLGGDIKVSSKVGDGTTFTIFLPKKSKKV